MLIAVSDRPVSNLSLSLFFFFFLVPLTGSCFISGERTRKKERGRKDELFLILFESDFTQPQGSLSSMGWEYLSSIFGLGKGLETG